MPIKSQLNMAPGSSSCPPKLTEGEDFYLENGFLVFTEKYLLGRGFCCGSGCRHCPFGATKKATDPTNLHEKDRS